MSGIDRWVMQTPLATLQTVGAFHPERFGLRFRGVPVTTLAQFLRWLNGRPEVRVFVELKPESAEFFGHQVLLERCQDALRVLVRPEAVAAVISKDVECLEGVRGHGPWPIGWVLPGWDDGRERQAQRLDPDYLVVDKQLLPTDPAALWAGRWQWVVYTLDDPAELQRFVPWPIQYVETDRVDAFLT
jgi:glycerophosphoryl diester phosphodiesterase